MLKGKVLHILERQKGDVVTGGELAKALGVSRTSIWKAIHSLQAEGNQILPVPNVGYKLLPTNDTLSRMVIQEKLHTRFVGQSMTLLDSVHSTNQYVKEQDMGMLEEGHVVIANEQLKGRGRRGRPFVSEKGNGIYLSILLKPKTMHLDLRLLTLCAAVAVSKGVEAVCHKRTEIKWVNDIFLGGKKICGILTEGLLSGELQEVETLIVGIGINTGSVPEALQGIATSIRQETGLSGLRNSLAAQVLNHFEALYLSWIQGNGTAELLQEYESRLFIKGQRVLVEGPQGEYSATALGIDETGALRVQRETGVIEHLHSGEIRLQ